MAVLRQILAQFHEMQLAHLAVSKTDCKESPIVIAFLSLAYETGSRVSELYDIKLNNINWQDKYIRVFTRKACHEKIMPINERLLRFVDEYIKSLLNGKSLAREK